MRTNVATGARARVLIVDDDEAVLEAHRRSLRRSPYTIEVALGPAEAFAVMARLPFDIVIADQRMPGMSGLELLERLEERRPKVVRMVLSGDIDTTAAQRALAAGRIHRLLEKPCTREELLDALDHACRAIERAREVGA